MIDDLRVLGGSPRRVTGTRTMLSGRYVLTLERSAERGVRREVSGYQPVMDGFPGELGAREERAEDGHARLVFDAEERHLNQAGTLHGGVLATLVDAAMGRAARSNTEDGQVPATTQLTLAFLSAGRRGRMTVDAQVRKQGDQVLLCDADVEQDGRTLVHAVATFAVLQP